MGASRNDGAWRIRSRRHRQGAHHLPRCPTPRSRTHIASIRVPGYGYVRNGRGRSRCRDPEGPLAPALEAIHYRGYGKIVCVSCGKMALVDCETRCRRVDPLPVDQQRIRSRVAQRYQIMTGVGNSVPPDRQILSLKLLVISRRRCDVRHRPDSEISLRVPGGAALHRSHGEPIPMPRDNIVLRNEQLCRGGVYSLVVEY